MSAHDTDDSPARVADRRGKERRLRIIEGATACFLKYGVSKTTIDDVAAAVRISRRTIYRYFETKNELFSAVVSHELEELSRESKLLYEDLPFADAVVEATLTMNRRVAESPTLAGLFTASMAGETLDVLFGEQDFLNLVRQYLAVYIRAAQERGELRPGLDIDDAVEWVTHVAFSLLGTSAAVRKTDEQHVRKLLRTFVLPGLTGHVPDLEEAQSALASTL
ncbi:TetR/AcrR family transcriptional regulator [Nocardia fluminea]|uniref:TetR/AcrR family transcriptional regulator n=1 Tax=Nocardia fluminea TaxID=134984 RepID=UPI00343977EE